MAFRGRGWFGRGRGGGRGGGFERNAKQEPFILFPEDVNLANVTVHPLPKEERVLITRKITRERFWKESCYHLQDEAPKSKRHDKEVERYSDLFSKSRTQSKRGTLEDYLKLTTLNFPAELIQGSKQVKRGSKRLRRGRDIDGLLNMFAELEEEEEGKDETEKEKKSESEDEEEDEKVEEEESSDGDYNQNIDFDDDEDDCNMDEAPDEDAYD